MTSYNIIFLESDKPTFDICTNFKCEIGISKSEISNILINFIYEIMHIYLEFTSKIEKMSDKNYRLKIEAKNNDGERKSIYGRLTVSSFDNFDILKKYILDNNTDEDLTYFIKQIFDYDKI